MGMTAPHINLYIVVEEKNESNYAEIYPYRGECTRRSMSETHTSNEASTEASTEDHYEPGLYEIRIKGHLADRWADWFGGLTITLEDNGDTLLTGPVIDQAALHGLLKKVRDLGMPLISVIRVEPGQADASDVTQ
jgi:hypothetical protein